MNVKLKEKNIYEAFKEVKMFNKYTKRATEKNDIKYTISLYRIQKLKTPEWISLRNTSI